MPKKKIFDKNQEVKLGKVIEEVVKTSKDKKCTCPEIAKVVIAEITTDLGREDLNVLRDKINEIIKNR